MTNPNSTTQKMKFKEGDEVVIARGSHLSAFTSLIIGEQCKILKYYGKYADIDCWHTSFRNNYIIPESCLELIYKGPPQDGVDNWV